MPYQGCNKLSWLYLILKTRQHYRPNCRHLQDKAILSAPTTTRMYHIHYLPYSRWIQVLLPQVHATPVGSDKENKRLKHQASGYWRHIFDWCTFELRDTEPQRRDPRPFGCLPCWQEPANQGCCTRDHKALEGARLVEFSPFLIWRRAGWEWDTWCWALRAPSFQARRLEKVE